MYCRDLNSTPPRSGNTDRGEQTEAYSVENGEVKMSKDELIKMIESAGFEAVERDTVYNRMEKVPA